MTEQPNYAALAASAHEAHTAANEAVWAAQAASTLAAFQQVVYAAALAGADRVLLEPSDQGPHMLVDGFYDTNAEPLRGLDSVITDYADYGAGDLPDDPGAEWLNLTGVHVETLRGDIRTVTIDVPTAAAALIAKPLPTL